MMRQQFVIGNWKMHMTIAETEAFVTALLPHISEESTTFVGIAPPFTAINAAVKCAEGGLLHVGAQNMSAHEKGAYTGEIASDMLKEVGATFVLIGHSERRHLFHEEDSALREKVKRACAEELLPIFCIGEKEDERDGGKTEAVLAAQLEKGLEGFSTEELENLIIAYEPVWAIGTGKTATPEIAGETHRFIRSFISKKWGDAVGERLPLLYGGSVKGENAAALLKEEDIDGFLVGGASLKVETFTQIIQHAKEPAS